MVLEDIIRHKQVASITVMTIVIIIIMLIIVDSSNNHHRDGPGDARGEREADPGGGVAPLHRAAGQRGARHQVPLLRAALHTRGRALLAPQGSQEVQES